MTEARQLDKNVFLSIKHITPPSPPPQPPTPTVTISTTPPPADSTAPLLDPLSPTSSTASTTRASTPSSSTSSTTPAPLSPASATQPTTATTAASNKPAKRRLNDSATTDDGKEAASEEAAKGAGRVVKRARGQPRGTKGLRYFSILVCNKLSECNTASYNHIADMLIEESRRDKRDEGRKTTKKTTPPPAATDTAMDILATAGDEEGEGYNAVEGEEKNVRRRIYDALNVLMAIDMIVKDKKIIRWNGPPLHTLKLSHSTSSPHHTSTSPPPDRLSDLRARRSALVARLADKRSLLTEQVLEYVGMRSLLERNAEVESGAMDGDDVRLYFPFVLVNTARSTAIDCEMSEGRDAVSMRYSDVFSLHDQSVVVRMVGRGRERLWENIPKELQELVVGLDDERRQGEERERERREREKKEMEEERQRLVEGTRRQVEEMRANEEEEDEDQPGSGHLLSSHMLLADEPDTLPRLLHSAPFASPLNLQRLNTSHFPFPVLPSPPQSSFLSSAVSAAYLHTPFKQSPLTKHLSTASSASLSPSSPFLCASSYPALGLPFSPPFMQSSPGRSLSSSSPLLHSAAASSPFVPSLSSRASMLAGGGRLGVLPASSSRLFAGGGEVGSGGGAGSGGVRRANSLLLGGGVLSGDEAMSNPQIVVS